MFVKNLLNSLLKLFRKFRFRFLVSSIILLIVIISFSNLSYQIFLTYRISENLKSNTNTYNSQIIRVNQFIEKIDSLGRESQTNQNYTEYLNQINLYSTQLEAEVFSLDSAKNSISIGPISRTQALAVDFKNVFDAIKELLTALRQVLNVTQCVIKINLENDNSSSYLKNSWNEINAETPVTKLNQLIDETNLKLQNINNNFVGYQNCWTDRRFNTSDIIAEIELEKKLFNNLIESLKKSITAINTQQKVDFDSSIQQINSILLEKSEYQKFVKQSLDNNVTFILEQPMKKYSLNIDSLEDKIFNLKREYKI